MTADDVIKDTINTLRERANALEALLGDSPQATLAHLGTNPDRVVFDPDTDAPAIPGDIDGNRDARDWCAVLLWSKLRALNVRHGRGATPEESRDIAVQSGYRDGRGWNAWTHGWAKDADGNRWIEDKKDDSGDYSEDGGWGMRHLNHFMDKVGYALPEDLR
jgi:hypothetical protein